MSENTTEASDTVELADYGVITLKPLPEHAEKAFEDLGKKGRIRTARAVQVLSALIADHNLNCSTVRRVADDNKDPQAALEQVRISNPAEDVELEKINKRIETLMSQLEKEKANAYKLAEKQLTQTVSVEEAIAKRAKTQISSKLIRELTANLKTIASVVDEDIELEGGIMSLIAKPDSLRGIQLGSNDGETVAKLSVGRIYLDDEIIEKDFDTPKGVVTKTSFSILAAVLNKKFRASSDPANKVSALDLTNAMYDQMGIARGTKKADIKENEFTFTFTKTVNYSKNGEIFPKDETVKINVVFDLDAWNKVNAANVSDESVLDDENTDDENTDSE